MGRLAVDRFVFLVVVEEATAAGLAAPEPEPEATALALVGSRRMTLPWLSYLPRRVLTSKDLEEREQGELSVRNKLVMTKSR